MATTKDGTAIMRDGENGDDPVGERAAPDRGEAAERDAERRRPADRGPISASVMAFARAR